MITIFSGAFRKNLHREARELCNMNAPGAAPETVAQQPEAVQAAPALSVSPEDPEAGAAAGRAKALDEARQVTEAQPAKLEGAKGDLSPMSGDEDLFDQNPVMMPTVEEQPLPTPVQVAELQPVTPPQAPETTANPAAAPAVEGTQGTEQPAQTAQQAAPEVQQNQPQAAAEGQKTEGTERTGEQHALSPEAASIIERTTDPAVKKRLTNIALSVEQKTNVSVVPLLQYLQEKPERLDTFDSYVQKCRAIPVDMIQTVMGVMNGQQPSSAITPEIQTKIEAVIKSFTPAEREIAQISQQATIEMFDARSGKESQEGFPPEMRQNIEARANDALKDFDLKNATDVQKNMKIGQVMMTHGVSVMEKDGKLVATAPSSPGDVTINKLVGFVTFITAFADLFKKKEAKPKDAPATPEAKTDAQIAKDRVKEELKTKPMDQVKSKKEAAKTAVLGELDGPTGLRTQKQNAEKSLNDAKGKTTSIQEQIKKLPAGDASRPTLEAQLKTAQDEQAKAQKTFDEVQTKLTEAEKKLSDVTADLKALDEIKSETTTEAPKRNIKDIQNGQTIALMNEGHSMKDGIITIDLMGDSDLQVRFDPQGNVWQVRREGYDEWKTATKTEKLADSYPWYALIANQYNKGTIDDTISRLSAWNSEIKSAGA